MKILIIPSWYPRFAGDVSGSFFKEQAEQLAIHYPQHTFMVMSVQLKLGTKAWIKKILTFNLKPQVSITNIFANLTEVRITNFRVPHFAQPEVKATKILYNLLPKLKFYPDLIHAHAAWNGGYLAMELAKIIKCKYVITEHMEPFPWQIPLFIKKNKQLTNRIRDPLVHADRLIAVSNSLANRIAEFGIKRPLVLYNLVNEQKFKPKQRNYSGKNTFELLSIGALIPQKGMDILLNAFSQACKLESRLRLTIVGDGDQKNELLKLMQKLNITNSVNFVGLVDRKQIINYFHSADCFVLASRGETFGVVYAEAIACGLPIIATRCGGPEDIVNSTNGILTKLYDVDELSNAIITICQHPNKYNKHQIREDFLEKFSSIKICQQLIGIYEGLL